MPTIRDGMVATQGTNAINQDQLVVDMLDKIYTYDPQSNPMLTVLTAKSRLKAANAVEVQHLEDEPIPEWDFVDGAQTNVDTSIEVDNGAYFRAGDVVLNVRTDEYFSVDSVAANVLTATRGALGSTAAAMNDNDQIINLGTPEEEGSTIPVAKATVTTTKSNFTQIKRTPVDLSRTLSQVSLYGSAERPRLRRMAGAKHARDWEQILLHGKKNNDTSGAKPVRTAGGLDEHITTNVVAAGGTLTESELVDIAGDVFRFKVEGGNGGTSRAMLCSREVMSTIGSWGSAKLQTTPGVGKYGFKVSTFVTPHGNLDLVNHPLLEDGYAGYAYIVDMSGIMIRPLQRTVLRTNVHDDEYDGVKDEYLTEQSFSFIQEKAFAKITGVTF